MIVFAAVLGPGSVGAVRPVLGVEIVGLRSDLFCGMRAVIASAAAACVFVAVWVLAVPSPAVFHLAAVLGPGSVGAVRRVLGVVIVGLRRTWFVGSTR